MGWLYMHSLGGYLSPKTYLDVTLPGRTQTGRIVSSDRQPYAAVERTQPDKAPVVFAVVTLFRYNPRARDGLIFGYKDMDETSGPCERDCPAAILDLLTPTTYEYAVQWRADCRSNLSKRAVARKRLPKEGDIVVLGEPMTFTNGAVLSRFKAVRLPRRRNLVYLSLERGGYYRISGLGHREHRIEAATKEGGGLREV